MIRCSEVRARRNSGPRFTKAISNMTSRYISTGKGQRDQIKGAAGLRSSGGMSFTIHIAHTGVRLAVDPRKFPSYANTSAEKGLHADEIQSRTSAVMDLAEDWSRYLSTNSDDRSRKAGQASDITTRGTATLSSYSPLVLTIFEERSVPVR